MATVRLAELKTEIAAHKDYKDLTDQQWDTKCTGRGLHKRSQVDFDWLEGLYPKKLTALRERLAGDWDFSINISRDGKELKSPVEILDAVSASMDEWYYCQQKEQRLLDKLACVIAEQRLRKDEIVVRIGTHDAADYYIDYGSGSDASDGLTIGNAYKTITKYTTTEVRVPGDRAFLRANVVWLQGTEAVNITFDEDGSIDLFIELIGADSVTNDPWSDSSDVKPIIDFEDANFNIVLSQDDFWRLDRLDVQRSADTGGFIFLQIADHIYIKDCDFSDHASVGGKGINGIQNYAIIDGCTFEDTGINAIFLTQGGYSLVVDTMITAGTGVNTDKAFEATLGSTIDAIGCTFVATFSMADCVASVSSLIRLRNVNLSGKGNLISSNSVLLSEDDDAVFEIQVSTFDNGVISRGTTSPRAGGADSFAIMTPDADCGPNNPLRLGDRLAGFARVWKTAGSYTATVYARVDSAWDSALTAAECYMVTSELDNAGNATRVERTSTETINNATTWTAFTTSVTPAREGWIYFWFYLAEFEDASEAVDVDIKATVA